MPIIDTREELLMALTEASELEHGLACQYLFAAFSLKAAPGDGLTGAPYALVKKWYTALMRVAREEMEHLATVTNLLSAVGGAPHYRRPNFPQPARHYPPEIPFWLERFSPDALYRFVEFERNENAQGAQMADAPDEVPYKHVGELYAEIRTAFQTLPEAELFINTPAQDVDFAMPLKHVKPDRADDRAEAVAALTSLMEEGEAYGQGSGYSHYNVFKPMHDELTAARAADPTFDPARPVVTNPLTRRQRDVAGTNWALITDTNSRRAVEAFNGCYMGMVLMLQQYYAVAGENHTQREALRESARRIMTDVIRPLGIAVTRLPAGPDYPKRTAGASFEFYGGYRLSATPRVAWTAIAEKLDHEATAAAALGALFGGTPAGTAFTDAAGVLTEIRDELTANRPA